MKLNALSEMGGALPPQPPLRGGGCAPLDPPLRFEIVAMRD